MKNIVILGAGMAGLGAAYRLESEGVRATLYDQRSHPGGHTSSYNYENRFIFDEGGHVSFTKDERIQKLFADSVKQQYQTVHSPRINNYWQGFWIKHPAQCNLYGLPTDLIVDIIRDFVAASEQPPRQIQHYEDWLVTTYGETFARTFPMTYGRKYHTTDASNMSIDWLGPRMYRPDLDEVLKGALSPHTDDVHYVTHFRYPTWNGFGSYCRLFLDCADLRMGKRLVKLNPRSRLLIFDDGSSSVYDSLISSIPLPAIVSLIEDVPDSVRQATSRLAHTSCVCVNLVVAREDVSNVNWTYIYDEDFLVTRMSFPHLLSPHTTPPGHGSIQAELYFSPKYRALDCAPAALIEPTIRELRRCGVIRDDEEPVFRSAFLAPYANIIFDLERSEALRVANAYLAELGIATCGRYGEWGYHWTDESFKSGEAAAQRVLDGRPAPAAA